MEILESIFPLLTMMLATGIVGGILAGLLGVGGGIVIVPVLEFALGVVGVDPAIRMHIAIATSLATIIPTSLSSVRAHSKKGAIDFLLVKRWSPFVFLGAAGGSWLASQVDGGVLSAVFGVVALLVAIKMLLPLENYHLIDKPPTGFALPVLPLSIGTLSSMMGIGGGTLSVPILTLCNKPIHSAVGAAAAFGLVISIPGTIGFMINGYNMENLPMGSLGYVNLIGFAIISPMTVLSAPLGAAIAHGISKERLSMLFGAFLFVVAVRMLYRAMSG